MIHTRIKKVISRKGKALYYLGDGLWFGRTSKADALKGLADGSYTAWETVDKQSQDMHDELRALKV